MPKRNSYTCAGCKRKGVKLWRYYNTFADQIELFCYKCAGAKEKKDVSAMTPDGKRHTEYIKGYVEYTDQIGWLVPAVPCKEDATFWGYSSVPEDCVNWWKALPL